MPASFGRYELLKRLAGGGMGEVYLARQRGLAGFSKLIVIKTLLPHLCEDEEFINMFQDEARLTAQLIHPNICQTFEFDKVDGTWYIAMEYLRGEDVRRLWKATAQVGLQVPVPLICRIISDAAAGLHFAHELHDSHGEPFGIVHRDISPQNILVTFEGGIKIIDFGVAKAQGRLTHTRTGALKGKYSYMSPEQVAGADVDHRTDIFALGIVLHELLTSVRLFKAESDVSTIERVKSLPIPAPSQLNPSLPRGLDQIVLRALDRDLGKRFQSAQQFRLALEDYLVQERMSASSAHLSEFLKQVYKERLEQEARHGPMLGEAEPQAVPIGAQRAPSSSNLLRATPLPLPLQPAGKGGSLPFPFEQEKPAPGPVERATQERTPSQPSRLTNPGEAEASKQSVIDLSMIQTESGIGPLGGMKRMRLAAAIGSVVVIVFASILLLRPKANEAGKLVGAPPVTQRDSPRPVRLTVSTEPPGAALSLDGSPVGMTPLEVDAQLGRPLRLEVALAGYQPESKAVDVIAPGQTVLIGLKRLSVNLLVKSDPEDAEVADGARILGRTPFNWSAPKGEARTLIFRRAGYHDLALPVTITGAEPDLSVRLKKLDDARPASQRHDEQKRPPADDAIKLER